jgi:hypothetical protein
MFEITTRSLKPGKVSRIPGHKDQAPVEPAAQSVGLAPVAARRLEAARQHHDKLVAEAIDALDSFPPRCERCGPERARPVRRRAGSLTGSSCEQDAAAPHLHYVVLV